ncbi:Inner membrane protein YecN [Aliiroseovarius sp. xm-m-379]|uniref:MAPEG family protein n=1 Tax=unclassified Aliiroseovarius TaxID=2623558 RepID=UPI001567D16B|nr:MULTISPECIES: MAPEG family protein [unclassified Aliiroseovarius]NRP12577.1 Inner membrane protein YecN [Aliiroseovarius sp. xm-d-517]NRP26238.1 Inner membrane protein YecN [Aliiroseovarius sp. xm-m-379]NRP31805.1 Inner membrane protein YecN [Aliiroseovarius sp. xm-m-314]NRP35037.1 Inner membrane protein YecN [Aliiroseovarius sp. xm-a-104]NRP42530.1 Inner membrane protein YecN [Aliiroseovarius sp. xm-m-339-2]
MSVTVTPIYLGLLALLFLFLSARVIRTRQSERISVGDADNKRMIKAMRTQANCMEYVPIGGLLLLTSELQGAPLWAVHLLGGMLVAGRVMHAVGFGRTPQIIPLRKTGMVLTLAMIGITALANILHALI